MNKTSNQGRALLWAWAIAATCVGAVSSVLALYLLLHRAPAAPSGTAASSGASAFLTLQEESLPGRYKWIENGKESSITLFADHSFAGALGKRGPDHRWVLTRDSLWIIWANKTDIFNQIVSPGVYAGAKENGTPFRIEKEP
jgi:hypothetical protein